MVTRCPVQSFLHLDQPVVDRRHIARLLEGGVALFFCRFTRFLPFAFCSFMEMLLQMEPLSLHEARTIVKAALAEDIGCGDVTTLAVVPEDLQTSARIVAREELVVCGLSLAEAAFSELCPEIHFGRNASDGDSAQHGATLLRIIGPAHPILAAERVALNFLQRLSGIATLTSRFVSAVRNTKARILDTRKTTPGYRALEKYAVTCGGGQNHRTGLFDMVLIKDNHLAALRPDPNAVALGIQRARERWPKLKIEVEADNIDQVRQAVAAGADIVLLDNMDVKELRAAVEWVGGKAITEASGGVDLSTVRAIAETGVDFISVGALTHSARAVDIALDFEFDV
jgi:nicotinate-nucleotide pyrophosphorylase (carboxylating)